jgi:hypothetical protein
MITVYLDGDILKMSLTELKEKRYNVLVNKTNGYSHDWLTAVKFNSNLIQNVGGQETIWCTTKNIGLINNSSEVTFS